MEYPSRERIYKYKNFNDQTDDNTRFRRINRTWKIYSPSKFVENTDYYEIEVARTEARSRINRQVRSTYIPPTPFHAYLSTAAWKGNNKSLSNSSSRIHPMNSPTQALSIHRNSYFICSESATASKETPLPPPFSLSKRAPKSVHPSLSPFLSRTYASGFANPILYATKTIRTWATRFAFASIYIHPASFVHASTEFMYTVSVSTLTTVPLQTRLQRCIYGARYVVQCVSLGVPKMRIRLYSFCLSIIVKG